MKKNALRGSLIEREYVTTGIKNVSAGEAFEDESLEILIKFTTATRLKKKMYHGILYVERREFIIF